MLDHRRSFLDSEFKRVAKSLDQHYKYVSQFWPILRLTGIYRNIISVVDNSTPKSEPARLPETSKRHEKPPKPPGKYRLHYSYHTAWLYGVVDLAREEPPEPPKSPSAVSVLGSNRFKIWVLTFGPPDTLVLLPIVWFPSPFWIWSVMCLLVIDVRRFALPWR